MLDYQGGLEPPTTRLQGVIVFAVRILKLFLWSRWQDLNLRDPTRPPGSRPGALTKLSYTEIILAVPTGVEPVPAP